MIKVLRQVFRQPLRAARQSPQPRGQVTERSVKSAGSICTLKPSGREGVPSSSTITPLRTSPLYVLAMKHLLVYNPSIPPRARGVSVSARMGRVVAAMNRGGGPCLGPSGPVVHPAAAASRRVVTALSAYPTASASSDRYCGGNAVSTFSTLTRNASSSAASSICLAVGLPAPWPARVSIRISAGLSQDCAA